jgi:Protein of unknown function (DUF962)
VQFAVATRISKISRMRSTAPGWFEQWRVRHQSGVSFWLHAIGIPMTVVAGVVGGWQLWHDLWDLWWRPVGLFVLGYFLQWLGHRHEGNDMGEVILIKRWLGMPYVAVSPRYASKQPMA